MPLLLHRSLWTCGFNLAAALADVRSCCFDGVEGPVPAEPGVRREFAEALRREGVPFIAEIATGGGYVPRPGGSVSDHLKDFCQLATTALECQPRLFTVLGGCDSWGLSESVEFFAAAADFAGTLGISVCFETHRSRPTFNPWNTAAILRELPELLLTCDFSHWCCVCERLVLDDEPELLALVASRTGHTHARIGYAQGPQVPDPAAPEYREELGAHERWWRAIWHAQRAQADVTMTPEFGPDGYLQSLPWTRMPVADLGEVNRWMAARLRDQWAAAGYSNAV